MKKIPQKIKSFEIIQSEEWPEYDLKVTLKPCFKCNHKCWFCEEYDNNTKTWTKEQCDEVLEKLKDIPKDKQKIFFYFYGGEPTLSKYWEYLNYKLVEIFPERELFIQTHTNLSLNKQRLEEFLKKISVLKNKNHKIDICNSYHINKQNINTYIEKMKICDKYNALGFCFFSTELPKKAQVLDELHQIASLFPDKLKMKFTEIENLKFKNLPGYTEYLQDEYLVGSDNGKSLEYRYWLKYYPHLRKYFEEGWNFNINDEININYSDVKGHNIHKKFKFMKCACGLKNIVIDHNLKIYHCNDDFYNNINITDIRDLDLNTYLNKYVRCLNNACYDGLDHKKIK
jgi:organic radical activating enzyme|tara:strand:- start:11436 stop:12461 length:1026 start_codon:yes stop_codon:yes gene_type:complete